MEDILASPVPSRVLQSFINSEPDESEQDLVFPNTPPFKNSVNLTALLTLPRGGRLCTSPLPSHHSSISEDSEAPPSPTASTFSRKTAVKRNSIDHSKTEGKVSHGTFKKSLSTTGVEVPPAYDPKEPLVKHPVTTKQKFLDQQVSSTANRRQSIAFTRTKSINATIGPLTKEVCGKLNISWADNDPCVSMSQAEVSHVACMLSSHL